MLGLKLPTDPRWVNLAEKSIEDILTDHAYCEQKAASTSISIIQIFPDYEELVEALVPIVSEEWGHFKLVLDQLKKRGLKLGRQRRHGRLTEHGLQAGLGISHAGQRGRGRHGDSDRGCRQEGDRHLHGREVGAERGGLHR